MRRIDAVFNELQLTEEQQMIRGMARDFAAHEIAPHVVEWERQHTTHPDHIVKKIGEVGLFGITVPEERGGTGGGMRELLIAGMELGYQSPAVGITLGAGISLGIKPILIAGNEEQHHAYLGDLATGRTMACFGLTEPNVGSDAGNPECRATWDEANDEWVINGSKHFCTNRKWSSVCTVHALTDPDAARGHRTSTFLVPMDAPGLSHMEMEGKVGWILSSTGFLAFDDVRVPASALLGERNEGFKVMMQTLDGGRLFIAGLAIASIAACLDASLKYAQERHQFGRAIASYQRIEDILVDMEEALESGMIYLWHAATRYDSGAADRCQSAKVKRLCTERCVELTSKAMQLFGGASYIDESLVFFHQRDARVLTIGEGANQVLSGLIARDLLEAE